MTDVLCLRPEEDFTNLGVDLPATLNIRFMAADDPDLRAALQSARGLVIPAVGTPLDTALFDGSTITLVQITGAGVDRIDPDALARLGITVANVPGGSNAAVAEYVATAAAALRRRYFESTSAIRAGDYVAHRSALIASGLDQLNGLTVGIVGFGAIGQAVAQRMLQSGATVTYYDPTDPATELPVKRLALNALLAGSDVVTLHVPLLTATRDLIGSAQLSQMRPGAILINAARGGVVDEDALVNALKQGHIGGAAVDVYSTEPPAPDHPLLSLDGAAAHRLILTPHIAGVTRQSWQVLFQRAWDNVARVLVDGSPAEHIVNRIG